MGRLAHRRLEAGEEIEPVRLLQDGRSAPKLRFTDLELATVDETYTGRGETQEDGRLLLVLSDGAREVRVTVALARLRREEATRP